MQNIKPGIYRNFKTGNEYKVHFIAKHSETLEDMVVYEALYENKLSKLWVRPASMWFELKTINGVTKPKFEFVRED